MEGRNEVPKGPARHIENQFGKMVKAGSEKSDPVSFTEVGHLGLQKTSVHPKRTTIFSVISLEPLSPLKVRPPNIFAKSQLFIAHLRLKVQCRTQTRWEHVKGGSQK